MGLERLIQQLFGPTGYLRKGTRKMDVSGLLRDVCEHLAHNFCVTICNVVF